MHHWIRLQRVWCFHWEKSNRKSWRNFSRRFYSWTRSDWIGNRRRNWSKRRRCRLFSPLRWASRHWVFVTSGYGVHKHYSKIHGLSQLLAISHGLTWQRTCTTFWRTSRCIQSSSWVLCFQDRRMARGKCLSWTRIHCLSSRKDLEPQPAKGYFIWVIHVRISGHCLSCCCYHPGSANEKERGQCCRCVWETHLITQKVSI